jgi:membrane peptidoglycan carboxypeptidase
VATRTTAIIAVLTVVASAVVVSTLVAAWLASPSTSDFNQRVRRAAPAGQVALSRISPLVRQAVVATEDERFYRHHGIDVIGILRAIPYDLTHLSFSQGASTITEQLAKRLYLNGNDHSPWRKIDDAVLALRIEHGHSKEQILSAYLNTAYFGHGAVGIGSAARRYFGRSPATLSLPQASLLAGLIQAPSADDPTIHAHVARARQVDVLRSMVRNGDITTGEGTAVLARPLALRGAKPLQPQVRVDLAPGSAFVWTDVGVGAGLLALGAAALALRGRFAPGPLGAVVALVLVATGLLVFARSFRTL